MKESAENSSVKNEEEKVEEPKKKEIPKVPKQTSKKKRVTLTPKVPKLNCFKC